MDACPAVFKRGGYNFRLPPLKVRDLRLDLEKNISFSDTLLVFRARLDTTGFAVIMVQVSKVKEF